MSYDVVNGLPDDATIGVADDNQRIFNLELTKVKSGQSEPLKLQMCVTKPSDDDKKWRCYLNTIEIEGVSKAENLEIELTDCIPSPRVPKHDNEAANQWNLPDRAITRADGQEAVHIALLEFKVTESGETAAWIVLGKGGYASLCTENWPIRI